MLTWLTAHWADLFQIVTGIIAVASVVTALTPTQADDNVVATIKKVVDFLAVNVGHAKAPPTDPTTPTS